MTARQRITCRCRCDEGLSYAATAEKLGIFRTTLAHHTRNIMDATETTTFNEVCYRRGRESMLEDAGR